MTWWAVAVGALFGSPSRFLLDSAVSRRFGRAQPWGTLLVNVSGSAALGAVTALAARGMLGASWDTLLATGFCGSFTTFSAFTWETLALVEDRRSGAAIANVVATVCLGVGAAYAAFTIVGA